jgi:PheRS DNA binding domain 1
MAAPDLAATVLEALSSAGDACIEDTWAFAESHGCDHVVLVGALKSLEADAMIVAEVKPSNFLELTAEGKEVRDFC